MMDTPKTLPSPWELRRDYDVYPTPPLISAACIVQLFPNLEAAAARTEHGWCAAEGAHDVPGAGGQATKAVRAMERYRDHGDVDLVLVELHEGWRRTVHPGNFEDRYEPGNEKAEAIEPLLRPVLEAWLNG